LNPIDLDLLTITEFWLTPEHGEEILRSVCPDGFRAVKITRPGKRGGGLAVIHRDPIRARSILLEARPATFEKLALSLQFNSTGFNLVGIYRPPASKTDVFMSELSTLTACLVPLVRDFSPWSIHSAFFSKSTSQPVLTVTLRTL
jgi:hypothetical protein